MNPNFNLVLLHVHLDGSYRPATLFELAKNKGMKLEQNSVEELTAYFNPKNTTSLKEFLVPFNLVIEIVKGDIEALRRTSKEFVEDCAKQKVCYVETRFCPQILAGPTLNPEEVVQVILSALNEASKEHGVKVRVILASLREFGAWTEAVTEMAVKYKDQGVVGIDVAGDEELAVDAGGTHKALVAAFQRAEKLGIHRTVHAGENGPPAAVREAVEILRAERLGHGYAVLRDQQLYDELRAQGMHFEVCPRSSFMTGGYRGPPSNHPVAHFANDGASFSINTDDPTITATTLQDEIRICIEEIGLTQSQVYSAQLNAAKAAFLPDEEREQLVEHIRHAYGL